MANGVYELRSAGGWWIHEESGCFRDSALNRRRDGPRWGYWLVTGGRRAFMFIQLFTVENENEGIAAEVALF